MKPMSANEIVEPILKEYGYIRKDDVMRVVDEIFQEMFSHMDSIAHNHQAVSAIKEVIKEELKRRINQLGEEK